MRPGHADPAESSPAGRATVALVGLDAGYPESFPYEPEESYAELGGRVPTGGRNAVYAGVREALRRLGRGEGRFGEPDWNPLAGLVRPGNRVFLKPNLVTHEYRRSCGEPGDLYSVITHPSVVRALADYAALALRGRGELLIGDNPCIDADFSELLAATRLDDIAPLYRERFGIDCRVLDLRPRVTEDLRYYGFKSRTTAQRGDPEGEVRLDLGESSFFHGLDPSTFRGVFTDRSETIESHRGSTHVYAVSNSIWNADVFLSVPKLKAHHKVGMTVNVKGLVGINANKNLLIHWRNGFPSQGGDEFPLPHRRRDPWILRLRHALLDLVPEPLYLALRESLLGGWLDRTLWIEHRHGHERYRGAWQGNDTCWRMAADLYNVFVADLTGARRAAGREARFFSLVDGVRGGEGNGPFCPRAREARTLIAGEDLLAVDSVAARVMDYDAKAIRYLDRLVREHGPKPDDISVLGDDGPIPGFFSPKARRLGYQAPSGWPTLSLHGPDPGESDRNEDPDPCRG